MNSSTKIVTSILNFFFIFWCFFALQRIMVIGVEVRFLNAGLALLTSAIFSYMIWRQKLNFDTILKYSAISWVIGFILGIVYVSIFDPNEAQGIFLCIFWTAPFGWILGMTYIIIKQIRSRR